MIWFSIGVSKVPQFSIIVPVFDQAELLAHCLESIRVSAFDDYELLVSDDGTPDARAILLIAEQYGAKLVRSDVRKGSAAARNRAAREAAGDKLAFFDADVTLHPDTLGRLARAFEGDAPPQAVIGSYDNRPVARNRTSQFRNLLHAHVHQRSQREARTFWTACGAISRERFQELGGFDERYDGPQIEDVELGLRLHRAGGRILLAPEIQVTHHKRWTLSSMMYTDMFQRAVPWTALLRDHTLSRDLNFRVRDRIASALSVLALLLVMLALLHGALWWGMLALDLGAVAVLQASVLAFIAECRTRTFAALCFPLLLTYNLVCAAGLLAGLAGVERRRDRWVAVAAVASVCLVFGLQIAGGAYLAEFDADPDESVHFVSGLMVYDYMAAMPRGNPIAWAERYYLHYPKVAVGLWPPGFNIAEALWWLMLPPSRWSVLCLEAALASLAALVFYRLARTVGRPWLALGATLLLLATPVVQQSVDTVMADALCLLWSVLLADACARVVNRPSAGRLALVGLWLACAMFTKGTGACLLLAPVLALTVAGKWKQIPRVPALGFAAAVLAALCGWCVLETNILHQSLRVLGGVNTQLFWPALLLPGLAGWGIFLLAAGGIVLASAARRPAAVAAASMLLSAAAVSYVLRAMSQPRHWIIVLPALLLLAVELVVWLSKWKGAAIAAAVVALWLFPWSVYRQAPGGFAAFARRLPRPARILVSSNFTGEGAMVAAIAISEPRPSSMVSRASKTLEHHEWTAVSPDAVALRLDELGIDIVEMHTSPGKSSSAHHGLLLEALRASNSWRECGTTETLAAWCRVVMPAVAREPLRIDLTHQLETVIQEPAGSQ
ncbi:MAG: glycosyltransferase [Bryobacteraceae bacterium]